jgi:hypothetical protein
LKEEGNTEVEEVVKKKRRSEKIGRRERRGRRK